MCTAAGDEAEHTRPLLHSPPAPTSVDLPLPAIYAILLVAGLVAGTLNVLAGGGSLLTLPVMIFLGLPPTVANGTNRVAILLQNISAVNGFRKHGKHSGEWIRFTLPPAIVGGVIGTILALRIGDLAFQRILAVMMVTAALWMIWRPLKPASELDQVPNVPAGGAGRWGLLLAFFLIGVYGGFIQAGLGFAVLAICATAGLDLVRANALKVTIALGFTPVALALFAWGGLVNWGYGLVLAVGNVLGAMIGVRLAVFKGQEWIRKVVTVMVIAFAIRLIFWS